MKAIWSYSERASSSLSGHVLWVPQNARKSGVALARQHWCFSQRERINNQTEIKTLMMLIELNSELLANWCFQNFVVGCSPAMLMTLTCGNCVTTEAAERRCSSSSDDNG